MHAKPPCLHALAFLLLAAPSLTYSLAPPTCFTPLACSTPPAVTQQKLQGWEADLVDMESELLGVGNALDALSAAAVRRQAEREREVDSVRRPGWGLGPRGLGVE